MNAKLKLFTLMLAAAGLAVSAEEVNSAPTPDPRAEVSVAMPNEQSTIKPKRTRRTRAKKAVSADGTESQPKTKRRTRRSRKCMTEAVPMPETEPAPESAPVDVKPVNAE